MNLENNILQIPISDIIPNRFQPRLNFDDQGLEELANSIKQHGVIQPLVVRRIGDKYEIIAGERRFKASTMAGLSTVPAVVAQIDDNKSAEVAIVENVQRRDLSPIEEARSYKNLLDKGYLTQTELAKKMGISQSAIANKLRLLNLDEKVQEALNNNEISERHARSLLTIENTEEQRKWLDRIIKERMTVKDLDDALKKENDSSNSDVGDMPLIKPLDLEAIKNEATELPDITDSDILQKINEIEKEKKYNPDVIPVEQARNESKNNFFNFLENETVNMNMDENEIESPIAFDTTPIVDTNFNLISDEKANPASSNDSESVVNLNQNDNVELNNIEKLDEEPIIDLNNNAPFKDNFNETTHNDLVNESNNNIINNESDSFDPIDLIETLSPDYEANVEKELGIDLKSAINEIRNTKDQLNAKGFTVSLEEIDLDDAYQFIIKIKKD